MKVHTDITKRNKSQLKAQQGQQHNNINKRKITTTEFDCRRTLDFMSFLMAGLLAAASVAFWFAFFPGTTKFVPQACSNLEHVLTSHVVGQDLAIRALTDAVCGHLEYRSALEGKQHTAPARPLIISLHGPPGVGKSLTTNLLSKAMYNKDPDKAKPCPGEGCEGAKVVFGLDFTSRSEEAQLAAIRTAILEHIATVTDPLLIIQEYDKMPCAARGMIRTLLMHPEAFNCTRLDRAIILLESNQGFNQLMELLGQAGGRDKLTLKDAEKLLKDAVFELWRMDRCEDYHDTLRLTALIDVWLPFLPLQRAQVAELFTRELMEHSRRLQEEKSVSLLWDQEVVEHLLTMVDFDNGYPLEGGKPVHSVALIEVAPLLRRCPKVTSQKSKKRAESEGTTLVLTVEEGHLVGRVNGTDSV